MRNRPAPGKPWANVENRRRKRPVYQPLRSHGAYKPQKSGAIDSFKSVDWIIPRFSPTTAPWVRSFAANFSQDVLDAPLTVSYVRRAPRLFPCGVTSGNQPEDIHLRGNQCLRGGVLSNFKGCLRGKYLRSGMGRESSSKAPYRAHSSAGTREPRIACTARTTRHFAGPCLSVQQTSTAKLREVLLAGQFSDPVKIVATAVTPVVMVSATAILISGSNARYTSISDRVRTLTQEFRQPGTSTERRSNIRQQIAIFHRRLHLGSWAARALYGAVACFVLIALLISLSLSKTILLEATPWLFLLGLVLIAGAILLQLLELQQSNRTIDLESADVLP